jgi:phosphate transport system substrate-binding protein
VSAVRPPLLSRIVPALALLSALTVAGCAPPPTASAAADPIGCAAGTIGGQGSSAQASAMNAWIRNYQVACAQAQIAYSSSGSGAGVRAFAAGTGDFAGTDVTLGADALRPVAARCGGEAMHLPVVVGPIALAYNVAGLADLRLSPATIAAVFAGRITRWNDPAVARDNPGAPLPATPISPVHRADSSGTTDNFLRFLSSSGAWPTGAGSVWPLGGGLARTGSNRVAATVERTDGAIGYVEASYARFNNLPTARVGNAAGEFVALTDESAARTVATAQIPAEGSDLRLTVDYRVADPAAYPIVLISYEIVCRPVRSALTVSFLAYAVSPAGQRAAADLGYVPLPEDLRRRVASALGAR